jgi:hypothetical protein
MLLKTSKLMVEYAARRLRQKIRAELPRPSLSGAFGGN